MFSFLGVKSELRLGCLSAIEVGHLWSVLQTSLHDVSRAQNAGNSADHLLVHLTCNLHEIESDQY